MKLRQLRAAAEIARTGRIGLAAATLNASQPALTRSLQSLEKEIGHILFRRSRAGCECTEAGRWFTARALRAFEQLHRAETEVRRAMRLPRSAAIHYLSQHAPDHELHVAIKVEEMRNISAAARALGVSQPAANRSLCSLEQRLGVPLFERSGRQLRATPAGTIVIRRARLAFAELRYALEDLDALDRRLRGEIKIGVLPLARTLLVPIAISRLIDHHEDARVSIIDGTYLDLLQHLRNGEIDYLIGSIRTPPLAPDICSELLFEDDLVLTARSAHPVHARRRPTMPQLLNERWILPSKGVPLRDSFERIMQQMGYDLPRRIIETDSLAVLRSLLLEEDRIAVVSRYQIYHDQHYGQLKIIRLSLPSANRPVGVTTREDFTPTPLGRELLGRLREVAAEIGARIRAQRAGRMQRLQGLQRRY